MSEKILNSKTYIPCHIGNNSIYHHEELLRKKLKECLVINIEKYGFDFTEKALKEYLLENKITGFTREQNVRSIIKSLDRQLVYRYILEFTNHLENPQELDTYLMNFMSHLILSCKELSKKIDIFLNACVDTIYKYDENRIAPQCNKALYEYCAFQKLNSFTNKHSVRNRLKENVNPKDARVIILCLLNNERFQNPIFSYDKMKKENDIRLSNIYSNLLKEKLGMNTFFYQPEKEMNPA